MIELHWMTRALWGPKLQKMGDQDIFMALDEMLKPYMKKPKFLGSGGEGFVYRDGNTIKKFIINWGVAGRNIDVVFARLTTMGSRISQPKHLYTFETGIVSPGALLVAYEAEDLTVLTREEVAHRWFSGLEDQFSEYMLETMATGYIQTGLSISNFMMNADGILKLVDYGCDCLPVEEAVPIIGKYLFLARQGLYGKLIPKSMQDMGYKPGRLQER